MIFEGRTALVTGGSRGIGKEISLALAKEGANVIINYTSNSAKAEEVIAEIKSFGGNALAIKADISKAEEVEKLVTEIEKKFPRIDFLINNAGITRDSLLIKMKESDWDDVINTNLRGTFLCTKYIGKKMLKQKFGKIVNITSIVGVIGNPGQSNYSASKAGIIGFTKSIAKEFASRGINVNAIAPGFIETDMTHNLPEKVKEDYIKNIPLGRLGKPEDIAKVVIFLCSDSADYITGQVINVDGGMVI